MAYDGARHETILFGGQNNDPLGDMWLRRADLPADLNGDGALGLADLTILLGNFGCTVPAACSGDLDADGDTDLSDLTLLLANFGRMCP